MAQLIPPDAAANEGTTNDDRALWAEAALLAFAQRTGLAKETVGDKEDRFLIISDLLADLGHWCDRNEIDLPEALKHAAQHYHAETHGTGKQFNP
ncbi:MAG: hypothetical protein LAO76_03575 [Acidobacteriia bacterium]|nr:hypothetical protein [Terriglobia bacterium]